MAIIESFATAVSLASDFSAGRDGKKIVDLVEFQTWLIESGNQEIADAIEKSQATSIYIKALLNKQLPFIIESINEISKNTSGIPISLESLLNTQADVLLKAVNCLDRKITGLAQTSSVNQSSTGYRSPNIVQQGSGDFHLNLGDRIDTQLINNHYGISLEDHRAALKKREHEVVERLFKKEPSDRLVREVLEKELNAVLSKLGDLERSYNEELAARAEVENTLKRMKDSLPSAQAETALERLRQGDKAVAKALFDSVIEQADQVNELAGKAAYENGRMAKNEIRYWDARDYFQKAVRFQPENSNYNNAVGLILSDLGEYQGAIEYYQLALSSDLKICGEDHPRVATYHHNLGAAYRGLGLYDKAIEYIQSALVSNLVKFGEEDHRVAASRNELGIIYLKKGQYDKAVECFHLALTSHLKTFGEHHPTVAVSLDNMGTAFTALGQFDKAIEYHQLALISDLKTYGGNHPRVATGRHNLGFAYKSLGVYDKAIECYQLSLDSTLNNFGEDHPDVATTRANLAMAHHAIGQHEKTIEYCQLALTSNLSIFCEDHPSVATNHHNLGSAFKALGQYHKAIEHYQLALEILVHSLGDEHPNTKKCIENLRLTKENLENIQKGSE